MKKELQDKLYKKYPKIFVQKDWDVMKTCMCWGIECGDGWYNLIDELCSSLQFHTDKNSYPQVETTQVKQKFGGLSFYTNCSDKYLNGYIDFAASMSNTICENCGSNEDVKQTSGYITTLCSKCLSKHKTRLEKIKGE